MSLNSGQQDDDFLLDVNEQAAIPKNWIITRSVRALMRVPPLPLLATMGALFHRAILRTIQERNKHWRRWFLALTGCAIYHQGLRFGHRPRWH